jgi:hypothetical protein
MFQPILAVVMGTGAGMLYVRCRAEATQPALPTNMPI